MHPEVRFDYAYTNQDEAEFIRMTLAKQFPQAALCYVENDAWEDLRPTGDGDFEPIPQVGPRWHVVIELDQTAANNVAAEALRNSYIAAGKQWVEYHFGIENLRRQQ